MFTLTLRTLYANKMRLALTTFAVILGVSFIVSSFVLGDGLRRNFTGLSEEIVGGVDLEVQPDAEFGSALPLATSLLDEVGAIDGVRVAEGLVVAEGIQPITADGTAITTAGAPLIGFAWVDDPALSSFTIEEGRAPEAGLEFSIDRTAAASHDLAIGETYGVITPGGRIDMTLVGISRFGEDNATLGAVLSQYPLETAQELFGRVDQLDSIVVAFDNSADRIATVGAISAAMPAGAIAVEQTELLAQTTSDFTSNIDIINNILLGFAGVALFVSIFIIANTFAIVLGQRTKELALLRAIGASPAQVQRSALLEALLIGLIASALGIVGGIALNYGLQALFNAVGADLPDTDLIIARRTIITALVVGVGVTVLSSIGPARKASQVAPLAALQDSIDQPKSSDRTRNLVGVVVLGVGVAIGSAGLFGSVSGTAAVITTLAAGAVITFLGVTVASPAIAAPVIAALGVPLKTLGVAGELSTQNAGRSPRRTASTASSLMIGLALVTTALVMGESIKQSISQTLASEVRADYISSSDAPINNELIADMAASGSFDAVSGYRYDEIRLDGATNTVMGADILATDRLFDLGVSEGLVSNNPNTITLLRSKADEFGVGAGDQVTAVFPSGDEVMLTVAAVFENSTVIDAPILLTTTNWSDRFGDSTDVWAAALANPDLQIASIEATLADLETEYPQVAFENQADFKESVESQIDQLLVVINAMLVLAIVVALVGIANTMALSVYERTREIGLLRAVGMSRRQARRMIRWEAVQVALFGSLLGVAVGLVFGIGVVTALPDSFVSTLAFPVGRIAVLVAVCGFAGLLAAALPARRASRINVLDAISYS